MPAEIHLGSRNHNTTSAVGWSDFITDLETAVFDVFNSWLTAAHIGYDAQRVMMLRMMRLAGGGPLAAAEARRMVAEKMAAMADAQMAFGLAIANGSTMMHRATTEALVPFRRRVRANSQRLSRR